MKKFLNKLALILSLGSFALAGTIGYQFYQFKERAENIANRVESTLESLNDAEKKLHEVQKELIIEIQKAGAEVTQLFKETGAGLTAQAKNAQKKFEALENKVKNSTKKLDRVAKQSKEEIKKAKQQTDRYLSFIKKSATQSKKQVDKVSKDALKKIKKATRAAQAKLDKINGKISSLEGKIKKLEKKLRILNHKLKHLALEF